MFPIINHISDILPHIAHLPEIRHNIHSNGFQTLCAMIADNDTYSGEHGPWARECRGITFDRDGNIASRGLHKFFNVNERVETQEKVLPWDAVVRTMDKRDGSVINPVLVDGHIVFKSKKSFDSDVAILANKVATLNDRLFSEYCLKNGLTPTFELTSPDARIVIKYQKSKLTLLHIRDNVTGRYSSRSEIIGHLTRSMLDDVELVDEYSPMVWNEIKGKLETLEGVEGYCIQFASGEIVKAKTKWYLDRHHAMTALTERNVAELIIAEGIDDMKSYIAELGEPELLGKVENIEREIVKAINCIEEAVEVLYYADRELERKDFAIKHQKHRLFGLLMQRYLGKEPDFKEFYAKNVLKTVWEVRSL